MYRGRLWTMRQYAGFGTAEESNRRYRYLLSRARPASRSPLTCPPRSGTTPTTPSAAGEVGKVGVAIDSIDDMLILFDGIPLDQVTTSMTINATASILLASTLPSPKQGVDPSKLSGTIQNDILKEYIARGTYIYPPRPACG
jgi:methylmalonyl-CoA mutase, N-terminal domain